MIDTSLLTEVSRSDVEKLLERLGTRTPNVHQIWALMDEIWDEVAGDNTSPSDEALAMFYGHSIWLLNGLFVEQDTESLGYRELMVNWAVSIGAKRIADYGGGYGTLARMIAIGSPSADVELIEPYPSDEAIYANEGYQNLLLKTELSGSYDLVIATDVFEHVLDPVELLFKVAEFVPPGGHLLTANHFAPSIKCHLPRSFHLDVSWNAIVECSGFECLQKVAYGFSYRKTENVPDFKRARRLEGASRFLFAQLPRIKGSTRVRRQAFQLLEKVV